MRPHVELMPLCHCPFGCTAPQAMAPEWRQLWLDWEANDGAAALAAAAGAAGAAAAAAGSAAAAAKAAEDEKLSVLRELLSQPAVPPSAPPVWAAPAAPVFVGVAAAQRAAASEAAAAAVAAPVDVAASAAAPADAAPAPCAPSPPAVAAVAAAEGALAAAAADGGDSEDPEAAAEAEVAEAEARGRRDVNEQEDDEEDREMEDPHGEHAEPMTHHDGDAVEQEEWEDMVAMGRQQQGQGVEDEAAAAVEAAEEAERAAAEAEAEREQVGAARVMHRRLVAVLVAWADVLLQVLNRTVSLRSFFATLTSLRVTCPNRVIPKAAAAATAAREAELAATSAALRKAMERWQVRMRGCGGGAAEPGRWSMGAAECMCVHLHVRACQRIPRALLAWRNTWIPACRRRAAMPRASASLPWPGGPADAPSSLPTSGLLPPRLQASPAGRAMQEARAGLPIAAVRGEVLAALRDGDVVVVSGE